MSFESEMSSRIEKIIEAAITADLAGYGFYGDAESGYTGRASATETDPIPLRDVTVAPPGAPDEGRATDEFGQEYRQGDPYFAIPFDPDEIYSAWREAIHEAFDPWLQVPDPAAFRSKINAARQAAQTLGTSTSTDGDGADIELIAGNVRLSGDLTYLNAEISQFNGQTVDAFHRAYVARLPVVISGQWSAAVVLGVGLTAEQEIWRRAREDLLEIADRAREAMEAAAEGGGGGFGMLLKVLGAVASAATIFVTGGTGGAVIGGISTSLGILGSFIPADEGGSQELEFGADEPDEVLDKIRDGLNKLNEAIFDEEHAMRLAIMDARFELYQPEFDLTSTADLLGETDAADLGTAGVVDVQLETLRSIGNQVMPAIAGELTAAAALLDSAAGDGPWTRPSSIGLGKIGFHWEWEQMYVMLTLLLPDTAWEIQEAGEHLAIAAGDLGGTDVDVASGLQRHASEVANGSPIARESALHGTPLR